MKLARYLVCGAAALAAAWAARADGPSVDNVASARTPLMVNEDAWYFIGHRPVEEHTVEGLQKHIDRYAEGGKVTHMCFCVNGMRTAYPTKVGEPMWRTVLEDGTVLEDAKMAYRTMFEKGIDPFKVWIDRCREKRISPWISMRINDVHHVTTGNPRSTCAFWRKHPELRCTPNVDPTTKGYWQYRLSVRQGIHALQGPGMRSGLCCFSRGIQKGCGQGKSVGPVHARTLLPQRLRS